MLPNKYYQFQLNQRNVKNNIIYKKSVHVYSPHTPVLVSAVMFAEQLEAHRFGVSLAKTGQQFMPFKAGSVQPPWPIA